MDDEISFVPKSRRHKAESPENVPTDVVVRKMVNEPVASESLTRTERDRIRRHYMGDKDRSYRNVTAPHIEKWNAKEDTTKRDHTESELVIEERDFDELSVHRRRNKPNDTAELYRRDRIWRAENDVSILAKTRVQCSPLREWQEGLPLEICRVLRECGFDCPLPVQGQCVPLSLSGHDVIGLSQPGTGKTLAYSIPVITRVLQSAGSFDPTEGPLGVILVPTHELAEQVNEVVSRICEPLGLRSSAIFGGMSINEQALALRQCSHIVIATPGRLNDVIESRFMVIGRCTSIVLDEADKMVDSSFGPQIERILAMVPSERHLMMFSATMPNEVLSIVEAFFDNVVRVRVGRVGDASTSIRQIVRYLPSVEKKEAFLSSVHGMKPPIIVFVNSRPTCEEIANFLGFHGFHVAAVHGGKGQKERDAVVNAVATGVIDIVVATEMLSRGIDIDGIRNVVNYDMPNEISSYVHRIGRTGRAGADGVATSFVTPEDRYIMYDLTRLLQRNNFAVPPEMLRDPSAAQRLEFERE